MVRRLVPLALPLLTLACATVRAEPPAPDPLSRGVVALEAGRWGEAESALHEVAGRCESGLSGVDALLLLSTAALDPGNPGRDPSRAAGYAGHVIQLPDVDAVRLALARGLYLAALDEGARLPASRVRDAEDARPPIPRAAPAVSNRFSACGEPPTPTAARPLPSFPGTPLAEALERERSRADSMDALLRSAGEAVDAASAGGDVSNEKEVSQLQDRVKALEAELARIRRLLRKGGRR